MIEEANIQHNPSVPVRLSPNDLLTLDDLLSRTEALPDILHLRAAERGYELTEQDKALLLDTYAKLDDILKEVAAFINIRFPGCERHVKAWYDIDFDAKIGPIKVHTTDREHIKSDYKKGMFNLISLIKVLKNETKLIVEANHNSPLVPHGNHINHFSGNVVYNERTESSTQDISTPQPAPEGDGKFKKWLEVLSWIAGIVGTGAALYALFK